MKTARRLFVGSITLAVIACSSIFFTRMSWLLETNDLGVMAYTLLIVAMLLVLALVFVAGDYLFKERS